MPLFVSRRVLLAKDPVRVPTPDLDHEYARQALRVEARATRLRKTLPRAAGPWALDSGGFTELSMYGEWRTTEAEYIADVCRLYMEVGRLQWVAPQDWMCEPHMLEKTGLTVAKHQRRTVDNFVRLHAALGNRVIPVLQGWTRDDYLRCWEMYHQAGVDLEWLDMIGVGSICRRQHTAEVGTIVRTLADQLCGTQLHAFGVKLAGLESFGDALTSADSMAWSYAARRGHPLQGCTHKSCANCLRYALRWRQQVLDRLAQQRLEVMCAA